MVNCLTYSMGTQIVLLSCNESLTYIIVVSLNELLYCCIVKRTKNYSVFRYKK